MLIGVISDTHGLLRPEAVQALRGCQLILHAGDVGDESVLLELRKLAPLVVVRGNVDRDAWCEALPVSEVVNTPAGMVYMLHNLEDLYLDPAAAGFRAVISGHSHKARIEHRGNVLYLNPGSAGPRRFNHPVSLAVVNVVGAELQPKLIEL